LKLTEKDHKNEDVLKPNDFFTLTLSQDHEQKNHIHDFKKKSSFFIFPNCFIVPNNVRAQSNEGIQNGRK